MTPKQKSGGFADDLNDLERLVRDSLLPVKDHLEGLRPQMVGACDDIVNHGDLDWVDPGIVLNPLKEYLRLLGRVQSEKACLRIEDVAAALRATVDVYRQVDGQ